MRIMMKKLVLLAAAAVMSVSALAENFWVGGSIGAWYESGSNGDVTTVNIMPEIGYDFSEKFAVATSIGYQFLNANHTDNHSFVFTPYARYTFYKIGIVGFFVDGGIDIALGSTKSGNYTSDTSAVVGIGFKPGLSIDLNEKCGLTAHLGFLGYRYANDAAKSGGFRTVGGFDFANGTNFGFYYRF